MEPAKDWWKLIDGSSVKGTQNQNFLAKYEGNCNDIYLSVIKIYQNHLVISKNDKL
jgi:hypothetical protein